MDPKIYNLAKWLMSSGVSCRLLRRYHCNYIIALVVSLEEVYFIALSALRENSK